ncbi:dephospho-CoA kinase [Lacrimispora xylanisolvens]|uniref:Dephospho-CoA kinase n=1 Tax=Lacrimispora xylanisolvens TaxID=384636 RepID=A0A2S6HVW1_9FIRM|nr:dephospho-CoA kinase [Hungatella xylanolytica]MBE5987524.1 dephospho-CoA kinase [Paenibacillaceae bacterium]PPK82079.1 dephospho-CoA kinase [Hungatella xylanolytica]
MKVIGLTGGVGAGKSLVLTILKTKYNAEVMEADKVAHELMEPGEEGYLGIKETFGEAILNSDGTINRTALGKVIFDNESAREQINSMIHPLVWKRIRQKISASQAGLIVVEFAIMGEEAEDIYDEMWYVHASEEVRMRRLLKNRGYSKERSEKMIRSQASEQEYARRCDRIIENHGSVKDLEDQLAEILKSRG